MQIYSYSTNFITFQNNVPEHFAIAMSFFATK